MSSVQNWYYISLYKRLIQIYQTVAKELMVSNALNLWRTRTEKIETTMDGSAGRNFKVKLQFLSYFFTILVPTKRSNNMGMYICLFGWKIFAKNMFSLFFDVWLQRSVQKNFSFRKGFTRSNGKQLLQNFLLKLFSSGTLNTFPEQSPLASATNFSPIHSL